MEKNGGNQFYLPIIKYISSYSSSVSPFWMNTSASQVNGVKRRTGKYDRSTDIDYDLYNVYI